MLYDKKKPSLKDKHMAQAQEELKASQKPAKKKDNKKKLGSSARK